MGKQIIVIDANIVMRALLNPQGLVADILINADLYGFRLCAPEFMSQELFKYQNMIMMKSHVSHDRLMLLAKEILMHVVFVSSQQYQSQYTELSRYMASIDPKDIDYVACAVSLSAILWTSDKKLLAIDSSILLSMSTDDIMLLL